MTLRAFRLRTALWVPPLLLVLGCEQGELTTPELYSRHCARCHGDRGQGVARGLKTYPRLDLLDSPLIDRGDRETVRQRIAEGKGPMPAFRRRLTPEQIERLTDFTLHLAQKENP